MPTIRRGSTGDAVRTCQSRLVHHGFPVVVDGVFGYRTEDAVRSFQRSRGLVADGVVGPLTWDRLLAG